MKHSFTLQYGLEYEGKTHFQAALKPLTIGGELNAMDAIDSLPALPEHASEAQQSRRAVQETLIYWAQQLSIDGIPQDIITADYLLNHLSGADYSLLVDEMEALRSKSTAATEAPAPPQRQPEHPAQQPNRPSAIPPSGDYAGTRGAGRGRGARHVPRRANGMAARLACQHGHSQPHRRRSDCVAAAAET